MRNDSLLVEVLIARGEAQLLFDVQPSAIVRSKLDACDVALRYLRGTLQEFERSPRVHGNLNTQDDKPGQG
jgi:hypothetical protein